MKYTKKRICLGISCLVAILLQCFVLKGFAVFVPYLAFCAFSFIICEQRSKPANVLRIMLFGLIILPVFDFVFSRLTVLLMSNLFLAVSAIFLQVCVYFFVFIFVNTWINKKKKVFQPKVYIILISLILISALLEGIHIVSMLKSLNQAIDQGNIFAWVSVFDGNVFILISSEILFYLGLFYASIEFTKEF